MRIVKDLIDNLHLNESPIIDTRRQRLLIVKLKHNYPDDAEIHELFLDVFGYPDDLPNLAKLRLKGQQIHAKQAISHHELRRKKILGEVY